MLWPMVISCDTAGVAIPSINPKTKTLVASNSRIRTPNGNAFATNYAVFSLYSSDYLDHCQRLSVVCHAIVRRSNTPTMEKGDYMACCVK
jgi:hypothetical protein